MTLYCKHWWKKRVRERQKKSAIDCDLMCKLCCESDWNWTKIHNIAVAPTGDEIPKQIMLTDCGNVPWTNLNKAKLNNGYIHLPPSNNPATTETTSIMDYESSSDAALLDQQEQQQLQLTHSNIITNPANSSNLASPQHNASSASLRNSISSSASPTNKSQSVVVVNLGNPNSMQTITTLQRNNVKNSSTKSNRSTNNLPIGNNNIKPSDNIYIFKANNNSRKYKFNLLKLSSSASSSSGGASGSTRKRLLIFAICLIIFGIAIGALTVHLSGIYHCNPDRIGT